MSKWQSIETCAVTSKPGEDRRRILVWGPAFGAQLGCCVDYGDGTRHVAAEGFHGDWEITHWMPLPEPPQDADAASKLREAATRWKSRSI